MGGQYERIEHRNAQTRELLEGGIVQLDYSDKGLVSARSLPIKEAYEFTGIPITGPEEALVLSIDSRYQSKTML
ncbi:uncharacterized protein N7473_009716 [Penicillium subrubescens]|uniref:uncharacterized protein n=1 Tax=Penicillium subrubescens TaxID=1316194 RepID=UPI0025454F76|nr:uncharacterized protein N7473_009716 [Penicillium subrubescens]KAJ5887042.1 hypothetical protein N7473_009716 [Penicillium subrubescens]